MARPARRAVDVSLAYDPKRPPKQIPSHIHVDALWDTGATGSVLSTATVAALGLCPVGIVDVSHAGGSSKSNTYMVNFVLPNRVQVAGALVTEFPAIVGNFGAIIGMDIITKGDLSITNFGGKTTMTYRFPSMGEVDYVAEANRKQLEGFSRNGPCFCGKEASPGTPLKFKLCHGKDL